MVASAKEQAARKGAAWSGRAFHRDFYRRSADRAASAAAAAAAATAAQVRRSITAELFGDPLPGRSALDQPRETERKQPTLPRGGGS